MEPDCKRQFVEEWVTEIFDGTPVPDYEMDQEILDRLYALGHNFKEKERQTNILISDFEKRSMQYAKEGKEIETLLKTLGITLKDLPPITQRHIEVLAEAALDLQVKDTSPASLSLGMSHLLRDDAQLNCQLGQLNQKLTQVNVAVEKASVDKDCFTKVSAEVSHESQKSYDKDTKFLQEKSQQYKNQIASLEAEIAENDFSEDIQHRVLQQYYQETMSLENKLKLLKMQLNHFEDLPPDMSLAKLKVHQSRQELNRLEKELSQHIDLVHAEK